MDGVTAVNHRTILAASNVPTSDPLPDEKKNITVNTSLSTLSPAHYQVMNTAITVKSGVPGGRPLTMRDVILWQQEQAQHRGELGFTTNFPNPSEVFKPFTINATSEDELPADDDGALVAAMQETHKATIQLHQRKIIMDGAGPLLAKTEMDVNQKLLAAGVPDQELLDQNLRQKIVRLVEIKHPPPQENFVAVLVNVASVTKGRSHVLGVNLPLKACAAEIYALLDEVVKARLFEEGLTYEGGDDAWRYQLIDQDQSRLPMDTSLPMKTDLDYTMMLQQLSKVGDGKAPVAVLTQGGLARPIDLSEADVKAHNGPKAKRDSMNDALEELGKDDDGLEVLDEDGKPYFEPLDMDRLCKKYADWGDDLMEMNGIHGFWR